MSSTDQVMHNHTRSIDEGFLNLPSPYHDEFSLPPTPLIPKTPVVYLRTKLTFYLPPFLSRFTYHRLSNTPPSHYPDNETQGHERKPRRRRRHVHWADTSSPPYTSWVLIVSLLLILSVTINAFLLFEGRGRHHDTVPHDAFRTKELGRNYTCYHTQKTDIYRVDRYERLDGVYDHYWRELLGGSDGYVYARSGGEVREARFGMFHQLECLYQIRRVLQASRVQDMRGESKRKDFVFVGEEGEKHWGHCFDYLRQVVLCGADDTVEVSDGVGEGWESFGYGERQCRDPEWLFDVTKCGRRGCKDGPFSFD